MAYAVGYRTGGRSDFRWTRVPENFGQRKQAEAVQQDLERRGCRAHVYDAALLDAVGLPETYE